MPTFSGRITDHFTWKELLRSQTAKRRNIINIPAEHEAWNITSRLCPFMEHVRIALLHNRIYPTSGFRSPELNKAIRGSKTSAHPKGLAMDFDSEEYGSEKEVYERLSWFLSLARDIKVGITPPGISEEYLALAKEFVVVDQLIFEYGEWIHIGLSEGTPRMMAFSMG